MANKGHLYEAEDGFRWQLRAGNGRIIAESGEAYTTKKKAQDAYLKVFDGQFSLHDEYGDELTTVEDKTELVSLGGGSGGSAGGSHNNTAFDALPNDPNHPLYSPLTIDGNK